jgi:hypothetical protein
MNVWKITKQEDFEADEKNPYAYSFLKLEKVSGQTAVNS